ncbi:hypothetical protein PRK78_000237 [Emydomyces testavorans]|uniref:Swi5-dependent recombination DNA repair protein 1 n=1 Tax=Emydomyces testavorans TaxID=2070801 RepID=A0AAF0DAB5_9EURO|nr:hypothetical protein PRK78_000237 [Emydomyces testavorans]
MASNLLPSAKRRRLNDAQSTLSKPFKSPLRRPVLTSDLNNSKGNERANSKGEDKTSIIEKGNTQGAHYATAATASKTVAPSHTSHGASPKQPSIPLADCSTTTLPATPTPAFDRRQQSLRPSTTPVSGNGRHAQQHITSLQKQLSSLHSQLSTLRTALDTTTQAIKIEQSNQDTELEGLIMKWQLVSREAAEELFASARERINRMGGVGVWRERMRRSKLRKAEWDAGGNNYGGDGEEDGEESDVDKEKEARRREIEEEIEAGKISDGDQKDDESDGEEDEAFTMDMMLKNLNVDLKVIGFDKVNQRWIY